MDLGSAACSCHHDRVYILFVLCSLLQTRSIQSGVLELTMNPQAGRGYRCWPMKYLMKLAAFYPLLLLNQTPPIGLWIVSIADPVPLSLGPGIAPSTDDTDEIGQVHH